MHKFSLSLSYHEVIEVLSPYVVSYSNLTLKYKSNSLKFLWNKVFRIICTSTSAWKFLVGNLYTLEKNNTTPLDYILYVC
jgi:hypothetical protein